MANERTYPCFALRRSRPSCRVLQVLRFTRVCRQIAPDPYAVVARDPAESYGSVIVVVPDVDSELVAGEIV
jgi:hypothetical protein